MKRRLIAVLVCVASALPIPARAADALKDTLAAIPGEAMAFIAVPNFKQLDSDYQKAIANLGLQPFVPPPMDSLVTALKQRAPMLDKMDEEGSIIVVVMPAASLPEMQMKQAVILSAKDPKALMEAMNGQPAEGGLWTVNLFGMPMYAAPTENKVVVSMMPDIVKAIKDSKESIAAALPKHAMGAFDGLDLIIWVDGPKLVKAVRPLIEGMVIPMMQSQAAAGGFQAKYNQYSIDNFKRMLDGLGSATIGVGLTDAGLDIRVASTAVPDSELAKRTKVKTTTDNLLTGLPAGEYAVVFGGIGDPEAIKAASGDLDQLFAIGADVPGLDKEKLDKLENVCTDLITSLTGSRGVFEFLTPGADGVIGLTIVLETTGADKWTGMLNDFAEMAKQLASSALKAQATKEGEDEKEVDELFAAITYTKEAETIAGAKTGHLKVDIDKIAAMNDADEEDIEEVKKLLGKDGLLFRVAAADDKNVVISFGGGEPRTTRFITAAKEKAAPLASDPGIQKISQHLPKERASVAYIALDHFITGIKRIQQHMEEEVLPIDLPALNAPVAVTMTGGDGWAQYDVFIPTEVMVAGKNAAMSMMGQQGQAGQPDEESDDDSE